MVPSGREFLSIDTLKKSWLTAESIKLNDFILTEIVSRAWTNQRSFWGKYNWCL